VKTGRMGPDITAQGSRHAEPQNGKMATIRASDDAQGGALMPTATDVQIRPAMPGERAAIKDLWVSAGMGEPAQEELDALMLHETSRVLVAIVDGRVVGTAVASFDGWRAYIYHVAVAAALRRGGIGHDLMAEAERYLRSAGARYVYLTVNEENTAGLALAAGAGYEPEGEIVLAKRLGAW